MTWAPIGTLATAPGCPQDSYNVGREYANSDFDIRQRFTLSLTYAIPGRPALRRSLEGWELNSIVTLETSQPWGPIDLGTDAAGVGPLPVSPPANEPIRWSFYGKPSDFKSSPNPIPYFAGNNSPTNPTNNAACNAQALAVDGGTPGASDRVPRLLRLLRAGKLDHDSAAARSVRQHVAEHVPRLGLQELRSLSCQELASWRTAPCSVPSRIL